MKYEKYLINYLINESFLINTVQVHADYSFFIFAYMSEDII